MNGNETEVRVIVYAGDDTTLLGFGKLVGYVTIYAVMTAEGLRSPTNAEICPSAEELQRLGGGEVIPLDDNPKIVLDDGRVVYGCQVWWQEMDSTNN